MALASADGLEVERDQVGQGHSERLIPMIRSVLARRGATLAGCSAIAFGAGPGSFTGLRIACAVAQGLALGAGLPLIPIDSLRALAEAAAHAHELPDGATVLAAQDARMGEVYFGVYRRAGADWTTVVAPSLARPEEIGREWRGPVDFGAGNAFRVFADSLALAPERSDSALVPDAQAMAILGLLDWRAGRALAADRAAPLYVRDRVALTVAERALARSESA